MRAPCLVSLGALAASLTGCGGGSGESQQRTYAFVTPAAGSVRTYRNTAIDNLGNTIALSYRETVTAATSDGSFTVLQEDPSHNMVIVGGTTYSIQTQTVLVNNSGQETSSSYVDPVGGIVVCNFNPHGAGPDFPVTLGTAWTLDYTIGCGSQAPVTYTQDGSVVDVESVTVPAGTFSAIKLQTTVTWTDAQGTAHTETVTHWRDTATTVSVKQSITYSRSGPAPAHSYPVSQEIVLESRS